MFWRWRRDKKFRAIVRGIFGIRPRNIELYKLALMHRSASITLDDGTCLNNERLEFLGDAILEAIVSDYLFIEFPRASEGDLTRLRAKIVSRNTLNSIAEAIGLDRHIIRHSAGPSQQKHIHGDALEAIIGALYLDQGYNRTINAVIGRLLLQQIDLDEIVSAETDHKSRLIESCQKNRQSVQFSTCHDLEYTSTHPLFRSTVIIDGIEVGHGIGETKKEAEQHAAQTISSVLHSTTSDQFLENIDRYGKSNG